MYCIPWAVVMNSNLHNLDISSSCHSTRFWNILCSCYDHWWLPSSAWELQKALFEILWDPVEFLRTMVKHSYMVIPFQNVIFGHGKKHLFNKGKLAEELLTGSSGLAQNLRYQGYKHLILRYQSDKDVRGHISLVICHHLQYQS